MNKFFGYALMVAIFSVITSWANFVSGPSSSSGYRGSSWSSSSGSWGSGGGGGGHK
ncbi:hypothetical protein [Pseudoduganella sp. HUAS MS19]